MNRRAFILLSAVGVIGASIPIIYRWQAVSDWGSPFAHPRILSSVTNRKNIKSIGNQYLNLFPNESNYNLLFRLLSDEKPGSKVVHESNVQTIHSKMDGKIKADFYNERTLILDGWLVSLTEARQCALFHLLHS